jgi:hypothetical protein
MCEGFLRRCWRSTISNGEIKTVAVDRGNIINKDDDIQCSVQWCTKIVAGGDSLCEHHLTDCHVHYCTNKRFLL